MPDLHGWITQQIDATWAAASAASADLGNVLGQIEYEDDAVRADELHIRVHSPAAVLRRCAADRRILARHTLDPDVHYEPACKGCGTYGDMELPETDNLNECPELLDLAYAHGLTDEILASLDQPVPPPRPEPRVTNLSAVVRLLSAHPTSTVPAALRGPNWKES